MNIQQRLIKIHHDIHTVIEKEMFTLMYISQCEDDKREGFIPYFYTIGLTQRGMPELFLSGRINPETVNVIFHDLIDQWLESEIKLGINEQLVKSKNGTTMRVDLQSLNVNHPSIRQVYAPQLFQHYEAYYPISKEIKLVQLIWPDTEGRLPLETGFSMGNEQTLLPKKYVS